jgi:hypothetical protein
MKRIIKAEQTVVAQKFTALQMRLGIFFEGSELSPVDGAEAWRGCLRRLLEARNTLNFAPLFGPEATGGRSDSERGAFVLTPGYTLTCRPGNWRHEPDSVQQWLEIGLYGAANAFALDSLLALIQQGSQGVGSPQLPYRVEQLQVWEQGEWRQLRIPSNAQGFERYRLPVLISRDTEVIREALIVGVDDISIHFASPVKLTRAGKSLLEAPPFEVLFKSIAERSQRIASAWETSQLAEDTKAEMERLLPLAKEIGMVTTNSGMPVSRRQTNNDATLSTGKRFAQQGWIGTARYYGPLTEFMPWLLLGQTIRVGQNTTFGWGRYAVAWC